MPYMVSYKGDLYKLLLVKIMAASAIAISSDSSDESVGSPLSQVILFGDIPTIISSISMVALETSTTAHFITSLPATLPFLYTDSSDGPPSQDPYAITVARRRSRVTACSSSPFDFLIAPVTALLGTYRRAAIMIQPEEAIPLDQRPSSSSSPMDSLPVHSPGLDAPDQAYSGSSTRVISPRLGYPLRPLHLSSYSAGPSRKRCRSLADSVPSSTPVMGSLAPTHANLLPPRKRFRDSYSSETSMEEDTEMDTTETEDDRELDTVDGDDVSDHIEVDPRDDREDFEASVGDIVVLGIDSRSVSMVDEEIIEPVRGDSSSSSGTRDGTVRSLRSENLKVRALLCIEIDHVDSLRLHMSRSQEEFRQIRDDRDDLRRKLRRLESFTEGRLGFYP
uniref:Uncharacterized protein n=1 Tax=Tanacetum cinerariifolium TaxID=118510 RepID=A0A6L2N0D1_TANCI|nr:hypothetical protein [Tanacetum cinerariifolium]